MWTQIRQLLSAPAFEGDEEKTRNARLLNTLLLLSLATNMSLAISVLFIPTIRGITLASVGVFSMLEVAALYMVRQGHVRAAGWMFSSIMWLLLTLVAVFFGGAAGPATILYFLVILIAGLVLGGYGVIGFTLLSIAAEMSLFYADTVGVLPEPLTATPAVFTSLLKSITFAILGVALFFAIRRLNDAVANAELNALAVAESNAALEARTNALERRSAQLQAAAAVSRAAIAERSPDTLLTQVTDLIRSRFGFYHTAVFLLDATGEYAVLRAASSEGGQRMLARGHKLRVGQEGIIGYVTRTGQARMARNVGEDARFFANPDLPDTRSEMALPLKVGERVIGALDVQSDVETAFGEDEAVALQTMVDQVAIAVENARLFQQVQESLHAERRAYGELNRQAWLSLLHTQPNIAFLSDEHGVLPALDLWEPQMEKAVHTGKITLGTEEATVSIPIKVRGQIIGVVDGRKPEDTGEWTPEEIQMLETLTEQLDVALDSARLYQETQQRAARDRLIGEVATRMRESLEMETLLRTAASEMRRALDLDDLVIRLTAPGTDGDPVQDTARIRVEEGTDDANLD